MSSVFVAARASATRICSASVPVGSNRKPDSPGCARSGAASAAASGVDADAGSASVIVRRYADAGGRVAQAARSAHASAAARVRQGARVRGGGCFRRWAGGKVRGGGGGAVRGGVGGAVRGGAGGKVLGGAGGMVRGGASGTVRSGAGGKVRSGAGWKVRSGASGNVRSEASVTARSGASGKARSEASGKARSEASDNARRKADRNFSRSLRGRVRDACPGVGRDEARPRGPLAGGRSSASIDGLTAVDSVADKRVSPWRGERSVRVASLFGQRRF